MNASQSYDPGLFDLRGILRHGKQTSKNLLAVYILGNSFVCFVLSFFVGGIIKLHPFFLPFHPPKLSHMSSMFSSTFMASFYINYYYIYIRMCVYKHISKYNQLSMLVYMFSGLTIGTG